jgi:hypothetical protein
VELAFTEIPGEPYSYKAFGEVVLDEKSVESRMLDYIRQIPMAARSLGIRTENKIPNAEDVTRVAKDRLFVKIKLCST